MCAVAWGLNALDGVTAIPLLTQVPVIEWTPADSAFSPETFTLEGLGEDTLLTAALNRDGAGFEFSISATTEIEDIDDLNVELFANSEEGLFKLVFNALARVSVWLRADVVNSEG